MCTSAAALYLASVTELRLQWLQRLSLQSQPLCYETLAVVQLRARQEAGEKAPLAECRKGLERGARRLWRLPAKRERAGTE